MRIVKYGICTLILLRVFFVSAQDIHFSNFHTNVLHVNAAYTGFFQGKYRFNAVVRDQYRTVAVPYQTVRLSFDSKLKNMHSRQTIGYGVICTYDVAGDAHLRTFQLSVPIAHHLRTYRKTWPFSYGIMPGIYSNAIDFTYLRFPDQFDGIQYNPSLETQENHEYTGNLLFNINAGVQALYTHSKKQRYGLGISGNNLTKPRISFFDDDSIFLPQRWLFHGFAHLELRSDIDIVPACKIQFQSPQQEYHFGVLLIHYTNTVTVPRVSGGLWFRSRDKDAVILGIGALYNGYDIILNYDINISSLRTASKGHGAMELTVSYIISDGNKRKKMMPVKCPAYL